jgi:ankyrin repeat protein
MESIQQLLRAGADVNGEGNPIYAALGQDNGPAVVLLLRSGARLTDPHVAVFRKAIDHEWIEVVKLMLDAGTDINKPIDSGGPLLPPLEYALKVNKLEMAKFLIANKADVNLAAKAGGDAPLHLAAANKGGAALVILLIGAGANVNAANQRQETPLHVAIRSANEEAAKALLQAGAAINAKNSDGETPKTLAKGTPLEALLTSYARR